MKGTTLDVHYNSRVIANDGIEYYIFIQYTQDGRIASKEILTLVNSSNMYRKALQRDYKDLVDMQKIALAIKNTLEAYMGLDRFDGDIWNVIRTVYRPFIERIMRWDVIEDFMKEPFPKDEWM